MNDNKGQTIFLSVIGIATLLVAIIGATFAYFTLTVEGNEDASSIYVTTAVLGQIVFTDGDEISMTNVNLPKTVSTNHLYVSGDAGATNATGLTEEVIDAELAGTTTLENVIVKEFTISNTAEGALTYDVDYKVYMFIIDNEFVAGSPAPAHGSDLVYSMYLNSDDSAVQSGDDTIGDITDEPIGAGTAVTNGQTPLSGGNAILIGTGTFKAGTTDNKHIYKLGVAVLNRSAVDQNDLQGLSLEAKIQVVAEQGN